MDEETYLSLLGVGDRVDPLALDKGALLVIKRLEHELRDIRSSPSIKHVLYLYKPDGKSLPQVVGMVRRGKKNCRVIFRGKKVPTLVSRFNLTENQGTLEIGQLVRVISLDRIGVVVAIVETEYEGYYNAYLYMLWATSEKALPYSVGSLEPLNQFVDEIRVK